MNFLIYFIKILTVLSYLVPIWYVFAVKGFLQSNKSIFIFLFQGLLFVSADLVLTFLHQDEYSMFVFYFADVIRFISILYFYHRTIYPSKINGALMLLGIAVFSVEKLSQWDLHSNDWVFTVFSNSTLALTSMYYLYRLNADIQRSTFTSFLVLGLFFFISSSSLIISIYESEIRTTPSYLAIFAIVFYNVMEFIQNIGITFIVERLKKSGQRLFVEVSNNMDI